MKNEIYDIVNARVIELLEKGVNPWKQGWTNGVNNMPTNFKTKRPYSGTNVFLLGLAGYDSPYWLTFKQCREMGGSVKIGSRGTPIIYYTTFKVVDKMTTENDEVEQYIKIIPTLKYFTVFNYEQCEGLPEVPDNEVVPIRTIPDAEEILTWYEDKPVIKHGGNQAGYSPSRDIILIPHKEQFETIDRYYSVLFHELVHSTGANKRLNREFNTTFGSELYSKEELIAEMGACYLCALSNIESTINNSVAYLQGWLKALKNDKRMLVQACSKAEKAVNYMINKENTLDK